MCPRSPRWRVFYCLLVIVVFFIGTPYAVIHSVYYFYEIILYHWNAEMIHRERGTLDRLVLLDWLTTGASGPSHDDVIKLKHFPRYWPFVRGIHRSSVNSPHKDQWRGALMFSLISAWTNGWINNRKAGDLRRHRAHYDVTLMRHWCALRTIFLAAENEECSVKIKKHTHTQRTYPKFIKR